MKLLALSIHGFRGIQEANLRFNKHDLLIGPNGAGKSTIIDALLLVFARTRLVRDLTEHDFYGSRPDATSRIRIVATLAGFDGNDPSLHDEWFREGRAVPKWWNAHTGKADPEAGVGDAVLCAQIAFAARFDLEELIVESVRYFHDDDEVKDPFLDDAVQPVPTKLFDDIGFYVLPARRTWDAAASFASELFRKAVATIGGIPAQTILEERDRLREPDAPLEKTAGLSQLVDRINKQLAELLPEAPRFQLRITATDSESLLRALVPHYASGDKRALPVGRHGMGLLSLQTFVLLLELGRERRNLGKPFIFAMEEPELHIPPGMQRRLIAQAASIAEQTICTSHSPRVAAYYSATAVQILDCNAKRLVATPLLVAPLDSTATAARRKLFHDDRARLVEALMHHRVLIPEGRSEYEWFRLLSEVVETGELALQDAGADTPEFSTVVGVVPTHNGAVAEVYGALCALRNGLVPLVDGDQPGSDKIESARAQVPPPPIVLQWRASWTVEDAIGWILKGAESEAVNELRSRINREFNTVDELVALFKGEQERGRLKTDYLAYEEIASVIGQLSGCRQRAATLLKVVTSGCLGRAHASEMITRDQVQSTQACTVYRIGT